MKVLLVTSEVLLVPNNYDDMICAMAACPQIKGLLILKNAKLDLLFKGMMLVVAGARKTGNTLMRNYFRSSRHRLATYRQHKKPVWFLDTINSDEAQTLIVNEKFDLVVNARTRYIYKRPVLDLPPLGCINIHHGILPEQRGLMCDLWALADRQPAGFTIHKMNPKIDDGKILEKVVVSQGEERDFMRYLVQASHIEAETLQRLLREIEAQGMPEGVANVTEGKVTMRKSPNLKDIGFLRNKGLIL